MDYCHACLRDVKKVDEKGQCPECSEFMEKEEKIRLLAVGNPPRWDKSGEIFFLEGKGWAIASNGKSFILGEEEEILEAISSHKVPLDIDRIKQEEYKRIFKILEERDDISRRDKGGSNKADIRAPKTGKRNSKRVRPVLNTGNRNKHPRQAKAPKKITIPRTRLKK